MAKHWRKGYRRKDGTWVTGAWVRGTNPKPTNNCLFWLIGMTAVAAAWFLL
ncbi:MAG TPA: hypothetical protein VFY14_18940 [Streptomyces sp.]|nr:hypothetical protein [Streptomyces sp.]